MFRFVMLIPTMKTQPYDYDRDSRGDNRKKESTDPEFAFAFFMSLFLAFEERSPAHPVRPTNHSSLAGKESVGG